MVQDQNTFNLVVHLKSISVLCSDLLTCGWSTPPPSHTPCFMPNLAARTLASMFENKPFRKDIQIFIGDNISITYMDEEFLGWLLMNSQIQATIVLHVFRQQGVVDVEPFSLLFG